VDSQSCCRSDMESSRGNALEPCEARRLVGRVTRRFAEASIGTSEESLPHLEFATAVNYKIVSPAIVPDVHSKHISRPRQMRLGARHSLKVVSRALM
jgi:hypothetical protein